MGAAVILQLRKSLLSKGPESHTDIELSETRTYIFVGLAFPCVLGTKEPFAVNALEKPSFEMVQR